MKPPIDPPYGYTVLGKGGTFRPPDSQFHAMVLYPGDSTWTRDRHATGTSRSCWYAIQEQRDERPANPPIDEAAIVAEAMSLAGIAPKAGAVALPQVVVHQRIQTVVTLQLPDMPVPEPVMASEEVRSFWWSPLQEWLPEGATINPEANE